jgi:8-oxo-dGTP pyrophosphatase MutT (NUDIX family)
VEFGIVNAVGVWFYTADTGRYLYLLRNDPRHPNTWGLPGGKIEPGETLMEAMHRECAEELGAMPDYSKLIPLEKFTTVDSKFVYHTFFAAVAKEFIPTLNSEHFGYAWVASGHWPKPLHPGLWSTVNFDAVQEKIATIERSLDR